MKRYFKIAAYLLALIVVYSGADSISASESRWFYSRQGGGFYSGRFFFDIQGGYDKPDIYDQTAFRSENEIWKDYEIIIQSNNPLRRSVSLLKVVNNKKPEYEAESRKFGIEYAVFDFLGIGLSYSVTSISAKNLRVDELEKYDPYFILGYGSGFSNPSDINDDPGIHDYFDLLKSEKRFRYIHSLDLELGIHPLNKKFDPYIKFAVGLNTVGKGVSYSSKSNALISRNKSRFGIIAGFRYLLGETFYINMDAYGYNYPQNVLEKNINVSLKNLYGAKVGIGLAL